jgi:aspartate carbamoyltransferase catalytic subunit
MTVTDTDDPLPNVEHPDTGRPRTVVDSDADADPTTGDATPVVVPRRHLLSVADLGAEGIEEILRLTDRFVEVSARSIPKVPALRGKTVVSLFFEDSTRTRLSFETAARRLSADVMSFSVASSSVNKGESLRDTVETIEAMGVDAVVVRHSGSGVPWQVAGWLDAASVINAGWPDPTSPPSPRWERT